MWLLEIMFWISVWGLLLVWIAYPLGLYLLTLVLPTKLAPPLAGAGSSARLSIVIAAHNEEAVIAGRISNILATAPADFEFETIVMSDHSADRTIEIVAAIAAADDRVKVFETATGRGRAAAHNEAVKRASGDIIVFTDAETQFQPGFLDLIGHAFDDSHVGFASGRLVWRNRSGGIAGRSYSLYWRFETWLRQLETHLGICAVASGACCAVRKELYKPLPLISDVDCGTPLDVVSQGSRAVFLQAAIATDFAADTGQADFKARVRMTSKNFLCTIRQWDWCSCYRRPAVALGLALHKIGRWLTPFLAAAILSCGALLYCLSGASFAVGMITAIGWAGLAAAVTGVFFPSWPLLGALGMFLRANVAFAAGIMKALVNRTPSHY